MTNTVSDFVPPYPPRLPEPPWPWERLRLARQNFVAMWEDSAFDLDFSHERMFCRTAFLCNSPESVQFAFSLRNASFERKAPQMRHALEPLIGDGLFISDGETWRQRRKVVAPILHTSRLGEFSKVMVETADELRQRWSAADGEINVLEEMAHLTAEIICRTVFGRRLGREYTGEIVQGFSAYQRAIGQIDLISFLGLPDWIPRFYTPAVRRAQARIHAVLERIIASYRAGGREDTAVIGRLLDARDDDDRPLSEAALRNEAAVLFMAGHETTANVLTWTWFLLSQCPAVEARLHAELDAVLGGRPPTFADIRRLPYTQAVIEEAMRLYPPVPILPREALQEETFQDVRIPKGALLFVVPWLLHRHRKLWRKPDHFIPERFLPGSDEPVSKFAYVPFSIGPRVCAGMSFGLTEAMLCVATLAQHFTLRLRPGHEVRPVCRLTLRPDGGLPMTLHARTRRDGAEPVRLEADPA